MQLLVRENLTIYISVYYKLYLREELLDESVFQNFEKVHRKVLDYTPLSMDAKYLQIDLQAETYVKDIVFLIIISAVDCALWMCMFITIDTVQESVTLCYMYLI